MRVQIAFLRLSDGTEAIMRGMPDAVKSYTLLGMSNANGGETVCQVERDVSSKHEENDLWLHFVEQAAKKGLGVVAHEKHMIWRNKATVLWNPERWDFHIQDDDVCFFMVKDDDMLIQRSVVNIRSAGKLTS
jgi:hypothetical protein